ncbi:acyl carrier protein [Rossellomorea vietnamensis]|uniref:Acyl carrier protein n=1 Tax=Rossellomorea vietnamensis TaxID=218284 RepID=A0A6I6UE51_9BACI|nr:phosphopantetheine-binding protein [Rossellomorea vietnamensis]QHE59807.1 acyl carrier protein [Rossellomorea vietnamensis]
MKSKIMVEENLDKTILELVKEILQIDNIALDENLKGLGLDSLNTVNLILALEDSFQIELLDEDLEPDNFSCINTVKSLVKRKLT